MKDIQIEKGTPNDVTILQQVSKTTFWEAFASVNTEEDMTKYLTESLSLEKLSVELTDENAAFYFATLEGDTIGYLKLNFGASQTDIKDPNATEIERIYILKAYQGQNIGQHLLDRAIEIARQKEHQYIWLGVWEENRGAIRFYERNGFVAFGRHTFMLGNDEQKDVLMKLQLSDTP